MKRLVLSIAAVVILAAMLTVTAFAHCGGGYYRGGGYRGNVGAAPVYYDSCAIEGCEVYGLHEHDGTWYHCADYYEGCGHYSRGCGGYRR